jgi:hypothetical protein
VKKNGKRKGEKARSKTFVGRKPIGGRGIGLIGVKV